MIIICTGGQSIEKLDHRTRAHAEAIIDFPPVGSPEQDKILKSRYGNTGAMRYSNAIKTLLRAELKNRNLTQDELAKMMLELSSGV